LKEVVAAADLTELRERVLAEAARGRGGRSETDDLVGAIFERVWAHPAVQAAAAHVLGDDFALVGVGYRCPAPGQGAQLLHVDWGGGVPPGEYQVCNAFLALAAFTEENGATRVVPGTHVYGRVPPVKPLAWRHPDERRLLGPAGSIFVFNGHVWHSGMPNRSSAPRPALVMTFGRRAAMAHV
jgi:ectoine hydroxylase-related dioxygenase (phytanoyl-CoA dioxygenase family)